MDIQTALIEYMKGTLNLNSIPSDTLIKLDSDIDKQLRLHSMAKNNNPIPHIRKMITLKSLINALLNVKGKLPC